MALQVTYDRERRAMFCRKWQVRKPALFGSALREDFGPHNDAAVLVDFDPQSP